MKIWKFEFTKLRVTRLRAVCVALASTVIITAGCYIMNNDSSSDEDNLKFLARLEYVNQLIRPDSTQVDSDVIFIDVAYDKQFIDFADENGFPLGQIDITDRGKLLQFINILKSTNSYKYVFMDVRFEKGYDSEYDDQLFAAIQGMPRIVVSTHEDIQLKDKRLAKKTALSDYSSSITKSDFVRFEYLNNGRMSTPLYMFHELTGKNITKWGPFYFVDGKLCQNCPVIRFKSRFEGKYDADGNYKYYELGADVLDMMSEDDIKILVKGKYIVISNLIDDVHDTYSGVQPGSFIIMTAFKSLLHGDNVVGLWSTILMAIIYFIITYRIFSGSSLLSFKWIRSRSRILNAALSFVGYSLILTACTVIMYMIDGIIYNIYFPSLIFSIVEQVIPFIFVIEDKK